MKVPFGIAQIGKAFRNEIVARQFIFGCANLSRWRCSILLSGEEMTWYAYWKDLRMRWHHSRLGDEISV